MKHLILSLFFLLVISASKSQDLPYREGKVYYSLDAYNEKLTQSEVYDRCNSFINSILNSDNVVVQFEDPISGKLVVKAMSAFTKFAKNGFNWSIGRSTRPTFTMHLSAYDNKASIAINEIILAKLDVMDEVQRPIEYDITLEKRRIQSMKGKARKKREAEFAKNAEMINDHFYSLMVLFKREIER